MRNSRWFDRLQGQVDHLETSNAARRDAAPVSQRSSKGRLTQSFNRLDALKKYAEASAYAARDDNAKGNMAEVPEEVENQDNGPQRRTRSTQILHDFDLDGAKPSAPTIREAWSRTILRSLDMATNCMPCEILWMASVLPETCMPVGVPTFLPVSMMR